ncbi:MAG: hypothetical protein V7679_03695 [Parasphingorhabdus sp.]
MKQYYRAYGLVFESEITLPFEPVEAAKADVTVIRGAIPKDLGEDTRGRGLWWAKPGSFLIHHSDGSGVLVRDGKEMIVDGNEPDMVRLLLTGSALTALLQQRNMVTLHASAVLIDGQAVGFFGNSGAGKSTTAAVLAQRGFSLIADDVLGLQVGEDKYVSAVPSFPKIGLWRNATEALGMSVTSNDQRMNGVEKYLVAPRRFHTAPVRLSHLFKIEPHITGSFELRTIENAALHRSLSANIHRKRTAVALGEWPRLFDSSAAIARQAHAYTLTRPRDGMRFAELADTIVDQVRSDIAKTQS